MGSLSFSSLWGARTLVLSLAVLVGSALVGIVVYVVLFASFSRLLRNSTSTLRLLLLKRTRSPARYFFPLLALIIAVQTTPLPDPLKGRLEHFFTLVLICLLGWLVITLVQVTATLIRMRYSIAVEDNLHAPDSHTDRSTRAPIHRMHSGDHDRGNADDLPRRAANRHERIRFGRNRRGDCGHGRAFDFRKPHCRSAGCTDIADSH